MADERFIEVDVHGHKWHFPATVKLPLKDKGTYELLGWDINIHWAVDAKGEYYACSGHGATLRHTTKQAILDDVESQLDRANEQLNYMRERFGKLP